MNLDLRLEYRLLHPIDRVWRYLTSADHLAVWLMKNDFVPEIGHCFRLTGEAVPGWRGWAECEVLELAPYRMIWAWWANDDSPETRVTFELVAEPPAPACQNATRLILSHRGDENPTVARLLDLGWAARFPALESLLAASE